MLQAVLQPGMSDNPAKFEETWKSWEHQVDVCENLSSTKLDGDVKISVVLREAPQKLRDHLLVTSQQFESYCNKLRAIIQAFLPEHEQDVDDLETDQMEVDYTGKDGSKDNSKGKSKGCSKVNSKGKAKATAKAKAAENLTTTKSVTC